MGNEKFGNNSGEWNITVQQESNSNSDEISDDERRWLSSLEKYPVITSSGNPKIQKVPKMHREVESNIKFYEPLVVAIGPFHHGKSKLQPMEKYKELLANRFVEDVSSKSKSISIDELYRRVKNILHTVKECYAEDLIKDYSNEEFAKMMFVDGCFILQYMYCIVTGNYKQLQMKRHDIAFIRRDLFLLENQLPFEVLQVLMCHRFKGDEGMDMIGSFIFRTRATPPIGYGFIECIKIFLSELLFNICEGEGPSYTKQESLKDQPPAHLLDVLRTQLIDPNTLYEDGFHLSGEWRSYRSATDLKKAGIDIRPANSRYYSDIKFNSYYCSARLTLPTTTIHDSTKSQLLNLVAYEACPDTPDDFGVTSYLCFMDSLIEHAEDVKELRSKGILYNFLGSDQEVANLFKEMARDLMPNPHAWNWNEK